MKAIYFVLRIIRITVAGVVATSATVLAQTIIPEVDDPAKQQIFISMGLEPEWITSIGYRHRISKDESSTNMYLGGGVKLAPLIVSQGAWRINFTQAVDRQLTSTWKGLVTNDIYLAHIHNRAGTMNGLGFDLRAAMLHYNDKWTKGFEVGWQYTALTHIKHAETTSDTFDERYPTNMPSKGPIDGWYGSTASRFKIGFLAGRRLGDPWSLQLGVGSILSIQKQGIMLGFSHAQVPLYINTQLVYGW